jgi:hypothetical protein
MLHHAARDATGIAAVPLQPIWTLPLVALLALSAFALGARDDVIRLWSGERLPVFVASEPGPPTMATGPASPDMAMSPARASGGGRAGRHGVDLASFPSLPRTWPAAWSGDIRSFFRQSLNLLHRPPPIDTSLAELIYDSGRGPAPPEPPVHASPCPEGGMISLCRTVASMPPLPVCEDPFVARGYAKAAQSVVVPAAARAHCVAPLG